MFVYSVRASTLRFAALLVLLVATAIGVAAFAGRGTTVIASADGEVIRFDGVRDNADRLAFLGQFGIECTDTALSEETFNLPEVLDRVLLSYNEIQKAQGLDLAKYTGKKVTRYTYEVKNAGESAVVNLIVFRSRVIAADFSSPDPSGFVKPLTDFGK